MIKCFMKFCKKASGSNHLRHYSLTFLCIFYLFISLKHHGQKRELYETINYKSIDQSAFVVYEEILIFPQLLVMI